MEAFRTRAIANGWIDTILSVMTGQEALNMLDHYGMITEAEIIAKYNSYMFQGGIEAQDSHNMQHCLEASLTPEARIIINADKEKYTIWRGDIQAAPVIPGVTNSEERRCDGLMYLYCIVNRTTAKTHATMRSIIRQINNMKELMLEKDSDVQAFNTRFQQLMNMYYAHKHQKVDEETMMTNLWDAYSICKDSKFVTYIQRNKEEWGDNHLILTP
jgi:hypothetical protein